MKTSELTADAILQSIGKNGLTSLGQLHRALGGKGSAPGSVAKRLKELVPNISELFAANKTQAASAPKAKKNAKAAKKVTSGKASKAKSGEDKSIKRLVKHAESNPFRDGCGYGILYDILASHPDGMSVEALKKRYMDITGKDAAHARYDLCVVLSAKESPTGPRHRSCREGFWVDRENDNVRLRVG